MVTAYRYCSSTLISLTRVDLVQKILKDYTTVMYSGKSIILCWISSHVNITGNERADAAAKSTSFLMSLGTAWKCGKISGVIV